ncbi:MAG: hypothetical protein VX593_10875 [Pseudomonadota bacterium]|nr:hypothetical protein [Pseudomonadota bacterium]
MHKSILIGASLMLVAALPAVADGYQDAPPPERGPAPLSHHSDHDYRHHQKEVRVVRVHRDAHAPHVSHSACGCCCAPVSYSRSYTTEPVVVRTYTRTYTRMAPPACSHGSAHGHHGHHGHASHHSHHHEMVEYDGGAHTHDYDSYHDGRYEHDRWHDSRLRYRGPHGDGPDYGENRITWTSQDGLRDHHSYTARRDGYSYYQARHD